MIVDTNSIHHLDKWLEDMGSEWFTVRLPYNVGGEKRKSVFIKTNIPNTKIYDFRY